MHSWPRLLLPIIVFLGFLNIGLYVASLLIPPAVTSVVFTTSSPPDIATTTDPQITKLEREEPHVEEKESEKETEIEEKEVETHMKETRYIAYLTSYTWFDNTPPGSSLIAFSKSYGYPTVHERAGGTGTYADPITIAVGHVKEGGVSIPDFSPGTRFYIPNVRAYFMVEDLCGDGDSPQNIPCHNIETADPGAEIWLDMWIEGEGSSKDESNACAYSLTGNYLVIKDPAPHYPVVVGPIINGNTCRKQFGDTF